MACNRVLVLSVLLLSLCWLNRIDARRHRSAARANIPEELDYSKDPARVVKRFANDIDNSWAYAAVGALEGQQARHGLLKDGKVVRLSADMLSECRRKKVGKKALHPLWAFDYVQKNGLTPVDYKRGNCEHNERYDIMKNLVCFNRMTVTGEEDFPEVDQLLTILAKTGPLMVGLDLKNIEDGNVGKLLPCKPSNKTNHFVLLAGYDKEKLIFKNSWGGTWGYGGYGHIKRSKTCNPFSVVVDYTEMPQ